MEFLPALVVSVMLAILYPVPTYIRTHKLVLSKKAIPINLMRIGILLVTFMRRIRILASK
jgi:hypothetical protein